MAVFARRRRVMRKPPSEGRPRVGKLARWLASERLQAGLLAALFVCIWWVIGLLTGLVLGMLIVWFTPNSPRWPSEVILIASFLSCGIYGTLRGWRLYRMRIPARRD